MALPPSFLSRGRGDLAPGDELDLRDSAVRDQPIHVDRGPGWDPPGHMPFLDGRHRLDLRVDVGVEAGDVHDVAPPDAGTLQYLADLTVGPLVGGLERLAVALADDDAGQVNGVAGDNRVGIAELFLKAPRPLVFGHEHAILLRGGRR